MFLRHLTLGVSPSYDYIDVGGLVYTWWMDSLIQVECRIIVTRTWQMLTKLLFNKGLLNKDIAGYRLFTAYLALISGIYRLYHAIS